jgi:phosphate starvation-inducible PhoH-like protein|tara:strand:- start:4699 stop:5367 length:669 start_codon:yes stop_codon:yes gene_type:complete
MSMKKDRTKNVKKGYRFKISLTDEQKKAKALILENDVSVLLGEAGSGKTLLACQIALQSILDKWATKIIITRPTISKEDIGHLPGNIKEKMDPWVAPIYGNMYQLLRKERIDEMVAREQIEIVPVSYMRGRTFTNSTVIVDECQNLDNAQTLMILQRVGVGSRMMFCGDINQVDLRRQKDSGLNFLSNIKSVKGMHSVTLHENYRHPILKDLLEVYNNFPHS